MTQLEVSRQRPSSDGYDQKTERDEKFVKVKPACTAVSATDCQHGVHTMCRAGVVRVGRVVRVS